MRLHPKRIVIGLVLLFFGVEFFQLVLESIGFDEQSIHFQRNDGSEVGRLRLKKPACQVPRLNPYDLDAVKHIKALNKLKCPKRYYSYLEGRMLVTLVDNVITAYFEYINRAANDDDHVEYRNRVVMTNEAERGRPKLSTIGCLYDTDLGMLSFDSSAKTKKVILKRLKPPIVCNPEDFWFFNPTGTIETYLERRCLKHDAFCSGQPDCGFILSVCNDQSDRFKLKKDGSIVHARTTKLLGVKENRDGKKQGGFTLVESTDASKWILIENKMQNINFRRIIDEDFVKVTIVKDRKMFEEFHSTIVENQAVINRAKSADVKSLNLPYSVAFLMVDSQSASNVKRQLPKTLKFLEADNNTFIFEGHTIVGDGTTAQLSAILAGGFEWDFPESRRGFAGAKPVDNWPFLFKDFARRGYVTMYDEDEPFYGTFNYRLHGFKQQPTDHYTRPFWLTSQNIYYAEGICSGDRPIYMRSLGYLKALHSSYEGIPKFSLSVLSAMFHDDLSKLKNFDDDLLIFLQQMGTRGYLDNTIFVLFGDHGARFDGFRETLTGKLEERLPFLSITIPEKLLASDPRLKATMQYNAKILTSHFDLHATLQHMLSHPKLPNVTHGQSLFTSIDTSKRTCQAAGVKDHWCPCLQFMKLNTTDSEVRKLAEAVVNFINEKLLGDITESQEKCEKLTLEKVKRAGRRMPNEVVQRFKQTGQTTICIECEVLLENNPNLKQNTKDFELVLSVSPSGAVFEASVKTFNDVLSVHPSISRLNRYGDQPKCIQDKYPQLRKYCYCKS